MTRAVIFDLYGTLIRLDRVSGPYLRLAKEVRSEDPWGLVRRSLVVDAPGLGDFAARIGVEVSRRGLSALEGELRRDLASCRLVEDAIDVLTALRDAGLSLGLISNVATPYKAPFFRLGLDRFFDAAVFSCDEGMAKPHPEIYLRAAGRLGHVPGQIVMVGDSRGSDYLGPKGVGMDAILLRGQADSTGYTSIGRLNELPATILAAGAHESRRGR